MNYRDGKRDSRLPQLECTEERPDGGPLLRCISYPGPTVRKTQTDGTEVDGFTALTSATGELEARTCEMIRLVETDAVDGITARSHHFLLVLNASGGMAQHVVGSLREAMQVKPFTQPM